MKFVLNNCPLVSVLMTAYNREKYIAFAIESVMASTYENWELIIVDDCSSDKTVEIARSYEAKESRIKVYINEENLGDYPNRNRAASYAKGKYLKYLDSDDYIYPHGLEVLVSMMEQFPAAGFGLAQQPPDATQPYPFLLSPEEAYFRHYFQKQLFTKSPMSAIIKKEAFEQIGGFKPFRMVGDFELWHRLSLMYPVVLMPHGLMWYRKHGSQEVRDREKFIPKYIGISRHYLRDSSCQLSPNQKKRALIKLRKYELRVFIKWVCTLKLSKAVWYIKETRKGIFNN